jgi:hypothetical protein
MDIINSSPQQSSQNQPEATPGTQPPEPQPQVHEPVVNHVHHRSKKRAFLRIFLTLLLAALAAAGVYFWQQGKTSDLQSQLNVARSENTTLKNQAETPSTQNSTNTTDDSAKTCDKTAVPISAVVPGGTFSEDLIAGDVDTERADCKISVEAIFKFSLKPTAVWVEYGTSPAKIDKATAKNTKGLGEGDPDATYSTGEDFFIDNTQLVAGTKYYYRTAATVGGKTLYSGVASFVTKK